MKKPWLAALLNFFLMGAGTFYNGRRKPVGAGLTVGAVILTVVENGLQGQQWALMFAGVFLINSLLAFDGYNEAQQINSGARTAARV